MSIETATDCATEASGTLATNERPQIHGRLDSAKGAVNDAITRLVVFGDSASASACEPREASGSS